MTNDKLNKKQIESLLKRYPNILEEENPSPEWWKVIKGLKLSSNIIIPWITQNLENPDMIKAFAEHKLEGAQFVSWLEDEFIKQEKNIKEPFRQAWKLLIYEAKQHNSNDMERYEIWFRLKQRINKSEYGTEITDGIVKAITPFLKIGPSINWMADPEGREENNHLTPGDLIHPKFETPTSIQVKEILENWQPENSNPTVRLCRNLTHRMIEILEFAQEQGLEHVIDWDVPSIEEKPQNNLHYDDFYPIVRLTVALWEKLNENNALKISNIWKDNKNLMLMQRMYLHALTKTDLYSETTVAQELLDMNKETFWGIRQSGIKKEIATLLRNRWDDFPLKMREKLEERILAGPPREKYRDNLPEERWIEYKNIDILNKLRAIENLSEKAQSKKDELEKKLPNLPQWQTDSNTHFESFTGEQGDPELLDAIPTERRIERARKLQKESFEQSDIWRKYCLHNPKGALEALQAKAKNKEWPEEEWRYFFWTSGKWKEFNLEDKSNKKLIVDVVEAIKDIPVAELEPFVDSPASWFQDLLMLFNDQQQLELWHKMMDALEYRDNKNAGQPEISEDSFTNAINRAEGNLTEIVFSWCGSREKNQGFETKIELLMDRLVNLKNRSGALIRTTMMQRIDYLHYIAPQWTEQHILPWLEEDHKMRWLVWDGYKYSRYLPTADLFNQIKTAMLKVITSTREGNRELRHRLGWMLILLLLYNRDKGHELTPYEVKQLLRTVDGRIHHSILSDLHMELRTRSKEEKEEKIKCFFNSIWPLDAKFITENILSRIVHLILDMQDAFPVCFEAVEDFLRPMKEYFLYLHNYGMDNGTSLPEKFPNEVLTFLSITIDRDTRFPYSNHQSILDVIKSKKPELENDPRFIKLQNLIKR